MKKIFLWLIRFYQRNISSRTAGCCRFYPTCSAYTYQAIERFGAPKGCLLGAWRILRCNPLCKGGYDPVPEKKSKNNRQNSCAADREMPRSAENASGEGIDYCIYCPHFEHCGNYSPECEFGKMCARYVEQLGQSEQAQACCDGHCNEHCCEHHNGQCEPSGEPEGGECAECAENDE